MLYFLQNIKYLIVPPYRYPGCVWGQTPADAPADASRAPLQSGFKPCHPQSVPFRALNRLSDVGAFLREVCAQSPGTALAELSIQ